MANGSSAGAIALEMGILESEVLEIQREIYRQELSVFKDRSADEMFVDYRLQMMKVVDDLDDLYDDMSKVQLLSASERSTGLGALKAKAKIIDDITSRGQDMGVIPRVAKSSQVSVSGGIGVTLGLMSNPELEKTMVDVSKEGRRIRDQYGDADFLALPEPEIFFEDGEVPDAEVEVVVDGEPIRQRVMAPPPKRRKS